MSLSDLNLVKAEKLNRTIFVRDNLEVLRCIEDNTVDLIYLDPPFNSNKNYGSPIGGTLAGEHFKDIWTYKDTDNAWWGELSENYPNLYEMIHAVGCINGNNDKAYLIFMAMRILEMRRLLKDTGSIYLHCDQTMSHSIKLIMDAIFGKRNFKNELVWCYNNGGQPKDRFPKRTDHIFFYSKTNKAPFYIDKVRVPYSESTIKKYKYEDEKGKYRLMGRGISGSPIQSKRDVSKEWEKKRPDLTYRYYLKKGKAPNNWFIMDSINQNSKERCGYSTQKPLALLERIIKASCPENGLVLDPFCGCATACIASEKLQRKWIGIDLSPKAKELIKLRMKKELGLSSQLVKIRKDLPIKNAPKPSKNIKRDLYGKQEGYCAGCHFHFQIVNLTIDHYIPLSQGGQDTDDNLQLLCGHCNSVKGDRPMEFLISHLQKQKTPESAVYHPIE